MIRNEPTVNGQELLEKGEKDIREINGIEMEGGVTADWLR
jgi:hypothetical protein